MLGQPAALRQCALTASQAILSSDIDLNAPELQPLTPAARAFLGVRGPRPAVWGLLCARCLLCAQALSAGVWGCLFLCHTWLRCLAVP